MVSQRTPRKLTANLVTVSDAILNDTLRHTVLMRGWENREVAKVISLLDTQVLPDLTRRITSELARFGPNQRAQALHKTARGRELIGIINTMVREGNNLLRGTARGDLATMAVREGSWQAGVISSNMPIAITVKVPPPALLRSIVTTNPFEGELWAGHWNKIDRNVRSQIKGVVNRGLVTGDSIQDMTRALTGTPARGFRDGAYQKWRRDAETIVRTATTHTTSHARSMTAKANEDVVKGEQWLSTLDARTTDICASLDQRIFKVGQGIRPPAHMRCRSTITLVMKSWREMGINAAEPPPPTRAARQYESLTKSLPGTAPGGTTYGKWLKQQPDAVQNAALGPGRAALYRRGKVPIERFTRMEANGIKPLTLKELQAVESAADKAGKLRIPSLPGEVR